jgi:acyl-coenzyme A thioesterase PaaI-like protein
MSNHGRDLLRNLRLGANALRLGMNLWPPFVGAGIHVLHIAEDYREVRVRMALRWYNRNYVGTHFGGSLYAMTDPFFMLMLMHNLGKDYVVWDKSARIHFRTPGKGTVFADFRLSAEQIAAVAAETADGEKHEPVFSVDVTDAAGNVVTTVEKTLHVRLAAPGKASATLPS